MRTYVFMWIGYNFISIITIIIPFFFLYQFRKVWISEKTGKGNDVISARLGMGFVSVIMIFLILFTMQIALLKILDFPYSILDKFPRFYGVVIEDARGVKGIQNLETGEILYDPDVSVYGIYNLEDNEVVAGDYVEVEYFPYSHGMFVLKKGDEIKQYEVKEDYEFQIVRREVQGVGILWGLVLLISSSVWTYKIIQKRKRRILCQMESGIVWRYGWVDKISLILGTLPLLMFSISVLGSWVFLWDNMIYIQRAGEVFVVIWIFGILLEVVPYHSRLTIQKETFQIGMADFLKKVYMKSDIKEICYVNGRKMEICMKSGKRINSWISNELYDDVSEELMDGSEYAGHMALQNDPQIEYDGEEAKEFYKKYIKFWSRKISFLNVLCLIILEILILTVICLNQDADIFVHMFFMIFVNGVCLMLSLKRGKKKKPVLRKKYLCQLIYIEEFKERRNQVTYFVYADNMEKKITQKGIEIFGDIKSFSYATLVNPGEEGEKFIFSDYSWADLEE